MCMQLVRYKTAVIALCLAISATGIIHSQTKAKGSAFFKVSGKELIAPDGKPFLLKGINLGNWLNPEGYMFLFSGTNSYRLIDQAFKEMIGPDATDTFWRKFQDNYITKDDLLYIKQTGMNSIRLPFHYKLFTYEDYMGHNDPNRGFELLDRAIEWSREAGLYVILDMHDAPGGQTGDNIDDSYGYPWLFENQNDQQLFCYIWQKIATHYAHNPTVIGYDLLNEPIAHYFPNKDELNSKLEPLYKKAIEAIRKVDTNHVVLLGGAQWNGNFDVFNDWNFDSNIMYTCHRYWCDTLQANIQDFIDFRNKSNRPIYMGETGENTNEWVDSFRRLLEKNNIGWHYWPYKKMPEERGMLTIRQPKDWQLIVEYTQKDRNDFAHIRKNKPDSRIIQKALDELLENIKFKNCITNSSYIKALGMNP
jgi:endoglucanase